jgi:predicted ABC-type ATPase
LHEGRVFLGELDRLAAIGADFAFESTLSGKTYVERIQKWKDRGYRIEIVYLKLKSPQIALKRIASRAKEGGHHVPAIDVRRRFIRSWRNFETVYGPLCHTWWLYDANLRPPSLLQKHP